MIYCSWVSIFGLFLVVPRSGPRLFEPLFSTVGQFLDVRFLITGSNEH
jgi:hypothetical protein